MAFGDGGKVRTSFGDLNGGAEDAVLQPDGKVVAVGFNATPTKRAWISPWRDISAIKTPIRLDEAFKS